VVGAIAKIHRFGAHIQPLCFAPQNTRLFLLDFIFEVSLARSMHEIIERLRKVSRALLRCLQDSSA